MTHDIKDQRNELLALAERAVAFGAKQVDQIEILVENQYSIGCEVNLGEMSKATKLQEGGAAVRCVVNHRVGCGFTNRLTRPMLEQAVKQAVAAAKASTPDETLADLPAKATYSQVRDVWDDAILGKEPGDFVDLTAELNQKIASHGQDIIVGEAGIGSMYGWTAFANSNGISATDRATITYAYAALVATTPSGVTPAVIDIDVKRRFDPDIDKLVERAVKDVLLAKKPAKGKTAPSTVVMNARTLAELFLFTLVPSVRGENVVRGRSVLAKRRGDKIAASVLSITDDGLRPGAFGTSAFDDEGVPRQNTALVENGRLRSFLWDSYWSHQANAKSTGSASRDLRTGLVSIQPSNIIIQPGKKSFDDLVGDISSGYLIKGLQGAHSSNQETGDFSVVGNPAFRIENGKLTGCCHGLMVSGNIFDLLQHADQVGSDVREYLAWSTTSVIGPSTRFADVQVVAKQD
jgi:PmbA protein